MRLLPPVGAMKIARHPRMLANTRVNGAVPPAPSLRELSSEARLRECISMNVKAQKFQSQQWLTDNHGLRITIGLEQPSDDTPSVTPLRACQLPQRGSQEGLYHSSDRPEAARFRAIFIASTKAQKSFLLPFNVLHSLRVGRNAPGPAVSTSGQFHRRIRSDFHLHQ